MILFSPFPHARHRARSCLAWQAGRQPEADSDGAGGLIRSHRGRENERLIFLKNNDSIIPAFQHVWQML
jgi:hypothetical protein